MTQSQNFCAKNRMAGSILALTVGANLALGGTRVGRDLLLLLAGGGSRRDGGSSVLVGVGGSLVLGLLVLVLVLLLDRAAILLFLLLFAAVASGADCSRDGARSVHLLAGGEVNLGELLNVVPPLHHLLVAAGAEGVGVLTAHAEAGETLLGNGTLVARNLAALNVELVALGGHGRGWSKGALRQEERELGRGVLGLVRRSVFVEVTGRGEDVERLLVSLGEALLALEDTLVNGNDRGVLLTGVVDRLGVSERSVRVKKVVRASSEGDPLRVGLEAAHLNTEAEPSVLDLSRHPAAPLVEGLPSALNAANDTLLKVGRVLLHDDDALLEGVLFVDLALELAEDSLVGAVRVLASSDAHGGVLEQSDGTSEIRDHLGRHLALLGDAVSELASVLLHVLDVGLDFRSKLLKVLHNGALDSLGQVGVVISDHASLVADAVVNVLDAILAEELVALAERNLDDTSKLGELLGGVVLNVGDSLKVADQLLGDVLPA